MSTWTEVDIKDVEIDGDDLNILYCTDRDGNCYIVLNIDKLKELLL